MAVAAAVLSLPNLFFGFADAPAAKAMTRARAVVPARIFLNIMTSSPLWGRSPDADARMSRHGNAAPGAVEVARGDVNVGDATAGPGTCRNRGRTGRSDALSVGKECVSQG